MATKQPTIAQAIISSLQQRGYTIVQERGRTSKYTVLHKEGAGAVSWMWVGASGACRRAGVKRQDASIPVSDKTRAVLLAWRADNLNATSI